MLQGRRIKLFRAKGQNPVKDEKRDKIEMKPDTGEPAVVIESKELIKISIVDEKGSVLVFV